MKFAYDGPVMEFNTLIAEHWRGETCAPSEQRARSNLAYQFKKGNNRNSTAKISLPGKLVVVSW